MQTSSPFQTAFTNLFTAYTGPLGPGPGPKGIGFLAAKAEAASNPADSFLYVYGANHAYFPLSSSVPAEQSPLTTGGFANGMIELAAVSHLGPALASLARMQELGTGLDEKEIRNQAQKLLQLCQQAEALNSVENWEQTNPVFQSYSSAMQQMTGQGLNIVSRYLEKVLFDESHLSFKTLRHEVLDAAFNNVMIGTFAMANLADHYQVLSWLDEVIPDEKTIRNLYVLISGTAGRATAGLTPGTNPSFGRLEAWAAHKGVSLRSRIYIAPGGPAFSLMSPQPTDWKTVEAKARTMWWQTQVAVELSEPMFPAYPSKEMEEAASTAPNSGQPPISDFISHLKFALENSSQELASCTSGFILHALLKNKMNVEGLWIPGLSEYQ